MNPPTGSASRGSWCSSILFGAMYLCFGMVAALTTFGVVQLSIAAATWVLFDRSWR